MMIYGVDTLNHFLGEDTCICNPVWLKTLHVGWGTFLKTGISTQYHWSCISSVTQAIYNFSIHTIQFNIIYFLKNGEMIHLLWHVLVMFCIQPGGSKIESDHRIESYKHRVYMHWASSVTCGTSPSPASSPSSNHNRIMHQAFSLSRYDNKK